MEDLLKKLSEKKEITEEEINEALAKMSENTVYAMHEKELHKIINEKYNKPVLEIRTPENKINFIQYGFEKIKKIVFKGKVSDNVAFAIKNMEVEFQGEVDCTIGVVKNSKIVVSHAKNLKISKAENSTIIVKEGNYVLLKDSENCEIWINCDNVEASMKECVAEINAIKVNVECSKDTKCMINSMSGSLLSIESFVYIADSIDNAYINKSLAYINSAKKVEVIDSRIIADDVDTFSLLYAGGTFAKVKHINEITVETNIYAKNEKEVKNMDIIEVDKLDKVECLYLVDEYSKLEIVYNGFVTVGSYGRSRQLPY